MDPKGNKTLYEYDRNGNCTKITDAEENVYSYQYDANDQLTQVTDPMGNGYILYLQRQNGAGIRCRCWGRGRKNHI
ncbi:MAG: RHS repeat domain-containing protein [Velocimicrobium sp.]